MSKWIVGSTTNVLAPFFALLEWTGQIPSMSLILHRAPISDLVYSIKERLRSGEMVVPGDQWPVFLYANFEYDPEDPWKGLLRSSILVCVRAF